MAYMDAYWPMDYKGGVAFA